MIPISFKKGTLIILVPNHIASTATAVEAKTCGDKWAIFIRSREGTLIGEGTHNQQGPSISVSGSLVPTLPGWYEDAEPMYPEPWSSVEIFGRSDHSIKLGKDLA